jgi:hypothetical protein
MARFSMVSMKEARDSVLPPRRATQERYREYLRRLDAETAGRLDLDADNDRPITERARLKAAAKSEGVNLHIQRRGSTIVFWPTTDAPKSRGGGARGRKRG